MRWYAVARVGVGGARTAFGWGLRDSTCGAASVVAVEASDARHGGLEVAAGAACKRVVAAVVGPAEAARIRFARCRTRAPAARCAAGGRSQVATRNVSVGRHRRVRITGHTVTAAVALEEVVQGLGVPRPRSDRLSAAEEVALGVDGLQLHELVGMVAAHRPAVDGCVEAQGVEERSNTAAAAAAGWCEQKHGRCERRRRPHI